MHLRERALYSTSISSGNTNVFKNTQDLIRNEVDEIFVSIISPSGAFSFEENIRIIDRLFRSLNFTLNPVDFKVGNLENEKGENQGTLKLLFYALGADLNIGQILELYSQHYRAVRRNPRGKNHKNIRELLKYPLDTPIKNIFKPSGGFKLLDWSKRKSAN